MTLYTVNYVLIKKFNLTRSKNSNESVNIPIFLPWPLWEIILINIFSCNKVATSRKRERYERKI